MRAHLVERPSGSRLRQDPHVQEVRPVRIARKRKRHRTGFEPFLLAALVGLGIWALLFWLILF